MAIGEFQPIDLLGMQGGLGNLPTAANVQALGNQQAAAAAGIEGLQARAMAERAQAQAAQQEQIDAQRFQTDLATFGDGSPKSIVTMMQRNPKYAKLLSDAHALEKADIQEADTLLLNGIYSRAANGDFAGAAAQARRRLEAERAAGNDTTDEQAMIDQLESGDPALQQRAMRVIGGDLAGRVGLEKFAALYGGVTVGNKVANRATGDVIFDAGPSQTRLNKRLGSPPSGYKWNADGTQTYIKGGPEDPAIKARNLKPIPPTAVAGIQGNIEAMRKVNEALTELSKNTDAVGLKAYTPDAILQRTDPNGIAARRAIGEIGAIKIHDLSGAAVSASEAPRFQPFVPKASDSPRAILEKLKGFKAELRAQLDEQNNFYGPDNGFRPYRAAPKPKQSAPKSINFADLP